MSQNKEPNRYDEVAHSLPFHNNNLNEGYYTFILFNYEKLRS